MATYNLTREQAARFEQAERLLFEPRCRPECDSETIVRGGIRQCSTCGRPCNERCNEAWDGDSESMHNDPAVIAREALSDE